jgi:hypothetical protein
MSRLRSSKLRQLGGACALGLYFLFAMWRADGISVEDTPEDSFLGLLAGASLAFVAGWFALPALAQRIGPPAAQRRSQAHRKRREAERRTGRDRRNAEQRAPDAEGPP